MGRLILSDSWRMTGSVALVAVCQMVRQFAQTIDFLVFIQRLQRLFLHFGVGR